MLLPILLKRIWNGSGEHKQSDLVQTDQIWLESGMEISGQLYVNVLRTILFVFMLILVMFLERKSKELVQNWPCSFNSDKNLFSLFTFRTECYPSRGDKFEQLFPSVGLGLHNGSQLVHICHFVVNSETAPAWIKNRLHLILTIFYQFLQPEKAHVKNDTLLLRQINEY